MNTIENIIRMKTKMFLSLGESVAEKIRKLKNWISFSRAKASKKKRLFFLMED
jgi:hypothetical protein